MSTQAEEEEEDDDDDDDDDVYPEMNLIEKLIELESTWQLKSIE